MPNGDSLPPETQEKLAHIQKKFGDLNRPSIEADGITISDGAQFLEDLARLGVAECPHLSLIPRNLHTAPDRDHLVYERQSKDFQILAKELGLSIQPLAGEKYATIHENDASVVLAGLVIAKEVLERVNDVATLVEFFKNVANYATRRVPKPTVGETVEVTQEVIVTNHGSAKRVCFKGPASSLADIVPILEKAFSDDD